MSIIVKSLSKKYGEQFAVNNLSFETKSNGVLGFLGPNGAGKTTTMKILTSFINPTSGSAAICGYDVVKSSVDSRRQIGYLPENNPLYFDMYVRESLNMVAGLYKVPKRRSRIDYLIELTGLESEQHKKIGQLSKGYKQRVGLAQAMMHDPKVLILDEPTSGLDPNQLAEIRRLIKEIGKEKTVLFSTHIMQEVEALCDQVMIINQGNLIAHTSIDQMQNQIRGENQISLQFEKEIDTDLLKKLGVKLEVNKVGKASYVVISDSNIDIRKDIFQLAVSNGWIILELSMKKTKMEDVFQKLTKKI